VIGSEHHRRLERLYAAAPVTAWYGTTLHVGDGRAEVRLVVRPEFHHAVGAVHGSVYFRLLDDAAFFAANSRVVDVLVLTVSFTVHFARPVTEGEIRAVGKLRHEGGRLLLAEAELFDAADQLVAQGSGVFSRSRIPLDDSLGYR
jgi:uncharacterized protein (TIGR00369 family)